MKTLPTAVVWLLCLAAPLSAQPQGPPAPAAAITKYDRGAVLAMLKQVKADLKEHYYDRAFRGMDIEQTFQHAEQRLKAATSLGQAVGTIADVLMRLDDSHTLFIPPDRKARILYGWRCQIIGDAPIVTEVAPGSDAEKQGVEVGDRVLAWNEYALTRESLGKVNYVYYLVRPQPSQRLVLRKADGAMKSLQVATRFEDRDEYDMPSVLASIFNLYGHADDREETLGEIFVWRYTGFGDPKDVDRVVRKARDSKSLILDLRGNGGGTVNALRAMVSWLFDRDVQISVERMRKEEKPLTAKGRKDAFAGRLIVLVDSWSGSSSEMLARLVQIEKRGVVMGDRTAGAVMTSRMLPHVYGDDRLTIYATMITVGDVRMADGGSLEKTGVTPDEIVLPTAADVAASRDPVLARAVAALGGTLTPEAAGRLFK